MIVRLEFPTDPRPKQRARTTLRGQGGLRETVMTFTPEATRAFEQEIRVRAQSECNRLRLRMPLFPAPQPVFVAATFHVPRFKTGPSSKLQHPTSSADLDNLVKALWDSMGECRRKGELVRRGVLWTDDSQVVSSLDTKLLVQAGQRPRITMVVADLESMAELVRSESESAIRRFSLPPGPGVVSLAATLSLILITSGLVAQVVATR